MSKSVADKVRRGELGRKTGSGWYAYDEPGRTQAR
jgi:3-hydroxyacyl-CoA dehydrogenase